MNYPRRTRVGWGRVVTLATLVVLALFGAAAASADPPVFSNVPASVTIEATSPSGAAHSFANPDAADSAGTPLSGVDCSPASGTVFPLGSTTVTCSVTDPATAETATTSFTVTVSDTTAPTVSVSGPSNVTTNDPAGIAVPYTTTVSDNVDPAPAVTCSPASGSQFAVGTTIVSCSSTDASGNTGGGTLSVTVTLSDSTAPVVVVPAPLNLTTNVLGGVAVGTFVATATDNVDGALTPSCNPVSGSSFAIGTTTVTCTAADASGNIGSASFPVNVALVDTTAPIVTAPENMIVEATSQAGAAVTFASSAIDNIDGVVSATCSPASGTTFGFGTTTVTCSATDTRSNAGNDSFTVTVRDTTAPVVTVGSDKVVEANSRLGSNVSYSASAADAIDGPLLPSAINCAPAPGARFGLGSALVTCSAADSRGNVGTGRLTVTVVDTTPPTLSVPAPLRLQATGAGLPATHSVIARFLAAARAADIADASPRVSSDAPAQFRLGTTTVTFTAVDASGNRATRTSTVTLTTESVSPSAQPDVVPPANVSNLRAQPLNRSVRLRWRAPADADFARVEVMRSTTTVGSESVLVYRGRAATFVDRRLANGTEYRYLFVSIDQTGNRSFGIVVVATPKRQLLTAPALGARVRVPPLLAWIGVGGASYYNVQVSRNGRKILSAWPTRNRLRLTRTWVFAGRRQRLAPGTYHWYVWPGLGALRESRYGALLGQGSFVVVR
jgi:HYR domain